MQKSSREKEEIKKIREFLADNGIELELTLENENYIDHIENKIILSKRQPHRELIYTALHEIGHYFCDFAPEEETHTSVVISEVLAWDLGRDIAITLGIDIDEDFWNSFMISCVEKYIKYSND